MLYKVLPKFKQFHKSVLVDMCILMVEPQLNYYFDFIIWCIISSFKTLLNFGKYIKIWPCQFGAVCGVVQDGEIKVILQLSCCFTSQGCAVGINFKYRGPLTPRKRRLILPAVTTVFNFFADFGPLWLNLIGHLLFSGS